MASKDHAPEFEGYEYVCNSCVTVLGPGDIGGHIASHAEDGIVVTRRDFYEREHGPVDGRGEGS